MSRLLGTIFASWVALPVVMCGLFAARMVHLLHSIDQPVEYGLADATARVWVCGMIAVIVLTAAGANLVHHATRRPSNARRWWRALVSVASIPAALGPMVMMAASPGGLSTDLDKGVIGLVTAFIALGAILFVLFVTPAIILAWHSRATDATHNT